MTEILNKDTGEMTQAPDAPSGDFVPPEAASDPDEDAIAAEMAADPDVNKTPDDGEPDTGSDLALPSAPTQPPGPTVDEMERGFKKVDAAATAYAKKVGEAFPDGSLNLAPCPLCTDRIAAFVDLDFAGRVPESVRQGTMMYLGFAREQEYEPDPSTRECRVCKGKGKTSTGSKVAMNDTRRCANCNGYGYYPPPGLEEGGAVASDPEHAPIGEHATPVALDDIDPTGEPRILPDGRPNPNYMKWPQGKVLVQPWGVTAGLTAQAANG